LLRARRERPNGRTTNNTEKLPSPHAHPQVKCGSHRSGSNQFPRRGQLEPRARNFASPVDVRNGSNCDAPAQVGNERCKPNRRTDIAECLKLAKSGSDQASFDHFVGGREQLIWDGYPQCLGGLKVDKELDLCRLLYRQLSRVRSLKYFVHEDSRTPTYCNLVRGLPRRMLK
jgi:hypothetical protein